jgi:hypothetical protein
MRQANRFATLRSQSARGRRIVGFVSLFIALLFFASSAVAQEPGETPGEEVIANLAAGRVIVLVTKQAILVATVENPIESETHTPLPVPLSSRRVGVMLGAVDWFSVTSQQTLVRFDRDLSRFHARTTPSDPRLQQGQEGAEASDLIAIGMGVLEHLKEVADNLHNKLNLGPDEPIAELILADYIEGYGPEVWQANFLLTQELQRGDYWNTRALRPHFFQFYPPEKGQPHTLMEFRYPVDDKSPTLLDLIHDRDPRIVKIRESDPKLSQAAELILQGQSNKVPAADALQFLRAALGATTPPNSHQTLATLGEQTGFEWVIQPPIEKPRPGRKPERPADAPTLATPAKERPPDAPTLAKPAPEEP